MTFRDGLGRSPLPSRGSAGHPSAPHAVRAYVPVCAPRAELGTDDSAAWLQVTDGNRYLVPVFSTHRIATLIHDHPRTFGGAIRPDGDSLNLSPDRRAP